MKIRLTTENGETCDIDFSFSMIEGDVYASNQEDCTPVFFIRKGGAYDFENFLIEVYNKTGFKFYTEKL